MRPLNSPPRTGRRPGAGRKLLALAVFAAAAASGPAARAADPAPTMVALGDSYAAGPLIPVQSDPWGCLKSDHNYAHQLAAELELALTDATCSGVRCARSQAAAPAGRVRSPSPGGPPVPTVTR